MLEKVTLFLLQLRAETTALALESIGRLPSADRVVELTAELGNSVTHERVLLLESFVLTAHHGLIVRISGGKSASMLNALVQRPDRVLLSLDLAAVVLHHGVALVLQTLVLSLSLHQLTLKLLKLLRLVVVLTSE